jgi:hypothetical protein
MSYDEANSDDFSYVSRTWIWKNDRGHYSNAALALTAPSEFANIFIMSANTIDTRVSLSVSKERNGLSFYCSSPLP